MFLMLMAQPPMLQMLPTRREYVHSVCRTRTIMSSPRLTATMWCCHCQRHFPLQEFSWVNDGQVLG